MSTEGPTTSSVEPPPRRPKVIKTNQQQVLLYVVLTLLLSLATVWAGRALVHNSETLTFAVGAPAGTREPSPSATIGFRIQPENAPCVHSS